MHILQEKILQLSDSEDLNELSLRAIGRRVGEEHPQKIKFHIEQLVKRGFFDADEETGELTRRNEQESDFLNIPLLGEANCGEPLLLADDEVSGFMKVSKSFIHGKSDEYFCLRAIGDSMNKAEVEGANINTGDYVLVRQNQNYNDGDYVVATLDNAATVKAFRKAGDTIQLVAESTSNHPPIVIHKDDIDSLQLHGVVERVFPG